MVKCRPTHIKMIQHGWDSGVKWLLLTVFVLFATGATSIAADTTPAQMSDELRSMVLNLNPNDIGVTQENFPHAVVALVMETGFPEGSFTLSSIADGSTSLYFSNGGGIIGGGEHENVREASGYLISAAQQFYQQAQEVTLFPKPESGWVIFYFITFDGVRSYTALEDDLGNEKDEFSDLFFAAHDAITELRITEGKMRKEN